MTCAVRLVLLFLGAVAFLFVACGGDEGGPDVTVERIPSVSPTVSPAEEPSLQPTTEVSPEPPTEPSPETPTDPSPATTAPAEPSPTTEPEDAPWPPLPETPPGVEVLSGGGTSWWLEPGETHQIDLVGLATDHEIEVPPCASFVFLFTWQVREPWPYPPEGVGFEIRWIRGGVPAWTSVEPSGEHSVGCGVIELVNGGPTGHVTVIVNYDIARFGDL